jgi:hypothetical protein
MRNRLSNALDFRKNRLKVRMLRQEIVQRSHEPTPQAGRRFTWPGCYQKPEDESNLKGIEHGNRISRFPHSPRATAGIGRNCKRLVYLEGLANWSGFLSHDASRLTAQVVKAAKTPAIWLIFWLTLFGGVLGQF